MNICLMNECEAPITMGHNMESFYSVYFKGEGEGCEEKRKKRGEWSLIQPEGIRSWACVLSGQVEF